MFSLRKLKKAVFLLQKEVWASALFKGVGAAVEHHSLLESLVLDCVVDVGANKGQFSLVVRGVFPQVVIHSFEPLSTPAKIFSKIFRNDSRTHLHNCAIGEYSESVDMHVSKSDDSSSLLPISERQSSLFPGTEEHHIDTVKISPLRSLVSDEDIVGTALLKIDVQGFELNVLKGCNPLIKKFKYIYVECSFVELYEGQALVSEIVDYLSDSGFVLSGVYNMSYDSDGVAIQGDFLFISGSGEAKV